MTPTDQASTSTTGQAPTTPTEQDSKTADEGQAPSVETLKAENERLAAELKETRQEAAKRRTDLKAVQEALDAATAAGTQGLDALKSKLASLETGLSAANERAINAEIKAAAAKAGFRNPDTAIKLIDREKLQLDGAEVKNADAVLAELAKAEPYLLGAAGSGDAGAGGDKKPALDFNEQLRHDMRGR